MFIRIHSSQLESMCTNLNLSA